MAQHDDKSGEGKPMNSLKAKFGLEVKILHAVDAYDNARVLVIGDPDNGVYEWAIERNGKVEEHSDLSYGNTIGALRDGLIAYWPPMDDGSTPSHVAASEKFDVEVEWDQVCKISRTSTEALRALEQRIRASVAPSAIAASDLGDIEDALWTLHSYESNRQDGGRTYSEADITKMIATLKGARTTDGTANNG